MVSVDEGNNKGVCDDVLDMEKIITGPFCLWAVLLGASDFLDLQWFP
jgi:hypothetical protein